MATYLVGDIHGCYDELMAKLQSVHFTPERDQLFATGDLVARGNHSLEVLRFFKDTPNTYTVLGNHDLHLLAVAEGFARINPKDKTQAILDASDAGDLLTWLRNQPLAICYQQKNTQSNRFLLTHAGIPPSWTLDETLIYAKEVESILRSEQYRWLLQNMYADHPDHWDRKLIDLPRYRYIINALTRMRFITPTGGLDMQCKLPPKEAKNAQPDLVAWFDYPRQSVIEDMVAFGHWAALEGMLSPPYLGLDTGCVWGGKLTVYDWENRRVV